MLLAGDIGATKTRLGIFAQDGDKDQLPNPLATRTFENARYRYLESIVGDSTA